MMHKINLLILASPSLASFDHFLTIFLRNSYALKWAASNGHLEIVKLLVTCPGVTAAADSNYALRWASSNGHTEVVQFLLGCTGVDPAAESNDAIQRACSNGNVDIVKILLRHPAVDPTANNNNALFEAASHGHYEVVKALLARPGITHPTPTPKNSHCPPPFCCRWCSVESCDFVFVLVPLCIRYVCTGRFFFCLALASLHPNLVLLAVKS